METWSGLASFLLVARTQSFTEAARRLGVPRSTVSRRVRRFEADLGATLLERSTRNVRLTDAGRLVFERGQAIGQELDQLAKDVAERAEEPVGTLRVASPTGLARDDMIAFMKELRARYPGLRVHQVQTDRLPHLLADDFDIIIHPGPFEDSAWIAQKVSDGQHVVVAAPSYIERCGTPKTAVELPQHTLLGVAKTENKTPTWPIIAGGSVRVDLAFASNDVELVRTAALDGQGLALLPRGIILRDLAAGRLQVVLPDEVGFERPLFILFSPQRRRSPKIRAYLEVLRSYAEGVRRAHDRPAPE